MADIGATLREARMRARIDINEVEARTKIRAKYLRAIENEEWDLLPGDVYTRSFLRTYGDFLGLDSRALIDDFRRRYEHPPDHDARPMTPRRRERERHRRLSVPPWALIGLVLLAVVVALYFVARRSGETPTATLGARPPAQLHRRGHGGGGGATGTGGSVANGSTGRVTRPRATSVSLQIVPTGQVYVCLVDARTGRMLIPGRIFGPGQTVPVQRAPSMLLTLGNAAATMKVNGRPIAIAPSSTAIGYRLTPHGHSRLAPAQEPRCT
jgi:cytoskeleton protein RodZ